MNGTLVLLPSLILSMRMMHACACAFEPYVNLSLSLYWKQRYELSCAFLKRKKKSSGSLLWFVDLFLYEPDLTYVRAYTKET